MKALLTLFLCSSLVLAKSQSIVGKWKTIDDNTGKPRSVVEIYQKGDRYYGKIVELFLEPHEDPDPVCEECDGKRKDQKILGMEIIMDMEYDAEEKAYQGGEILDPENGSVYDCKLWIGEDDHLKVRGYLLFLFRTQSWLPYEG